MRPVLVLAAALFAASAAPVPAHAQQADDPGLITISGTGEVTASPDIAVVTSGVVTDGKTAREALSANTEAMTSLIAVLSAAGIEERDIQTSGFSVQPNYVYSDQRDANGYQLPPRISGYRVSNAVTVRVRAIADLGRVLDQAVTVGANTINGVSFSVAETADLMDAARRAAVADALHRAKLLTDAAGVELGRIRSISEQGGVPPVPFEMSRVSMAADAAAVPVQAGELNFSVTVNVQWEIAQ